MYIGAKLKYMNNYDGSGGLQFWQFILIGSYCIVHLTAFHSTASDAKFCKSNLMGKNPWTIGANMVNVNTITSLKVGA